MQLILDAGSKGINKVWQIGDFVARANVTKGYWNRERVLAESRNYSTPSDFWKYARGAATNAKKNGFYQEAISHMNKRDRLPRNHYKDINNIFIAYRNAKSRSELNDKYLAAVNMAKRIGIHEMLVSTLPVKVRKPVLGTREQIVKIAESYDSVGEFAKKEPGTYSAASKLGILKQVTKSMKRKGNLYKRYVYQVKNSKYVYIGLTVDVKRRLESHKKTEDRKRKELFNSVDVEIIVSDLFPAQKAAELEEELIADYRKCGKLEVLNKKDGGQLGSPCRTETLNDIVEIARGKTSKYLKKHHSGTYKAFCKLPKDQKQLVRNVMRRIIGKRLSNDEVFEFCRDKTMLAIREEFPSLRKRIYQHPRKEELLAIMNENKRH